MSRFTPPMPLIGMLIAVLSVGGAFGPDPLMAQTLEVAPVNLVLPAGRAATTMKITNHGEAATTVQLRPFSWGQAAGENRLVKTQELAVSPPFATLGPGESQTVRVVLRRPANINENSYRLILDQLPSAASPGSVHVALRISLPVFAMPENEVKPLLAWWLSRIDATHCLLTVRNAGTRHARLSNISLASQGAALALTDPAFFYVLAGVEIQRVVTIAGRIETGSVVAIKAASDQGEISANVPIDSSN